MPQQLTERLASHCLFGSDAKQCIQNGGGVLASSDEFLRTHRRLQRRVEAASNSQFPIG
jgi:hypothetical protein